MKDDLYRYYKQKISIYKFIVEFILNKHIRFLYYYRKKTVFSRIMLRIFSEKYGLEIFSKNIGSGLYIGHANCITINQNAIIGKNCNIHKGVTIGQENRGNRRGTPVIGNEVWIGINSTIVGNIKIGNDVLIAPNSYVNFDIPDHSIVIGNPGVIKHKENATEGYINNKI